MLLGVRTVYGGPGQLPPHPLSSFAIGVAAVPRHGTLFTWTLQTLPVTASVRESSFEGSAVLQGLLHLPMSQILARQLPSHVLSCVSDEVINGVALGLFTWPLVRRTHTPQTGDNASLNPRCSRHLLAYRPDALTNELANPLITFV